ncbi:hypothetical protein AXF42_Ash001587 [Apostasia shenzhenica]|uniref:Uncharacterized protein n=1 Tax=Apostasia shenzhenica TaxID=1088818 RepID=A0A2I0AAR9_9ASPA|nr:hypothetical protein AXF42_Ash001587 [Apostasia shenzhenica]
MQADISSKDSPCFHKQEKAIHQTPEATNGTGDSIKVGTTGRVASLMSQELDSMKNNPPASSSQRRTQTPPVSVPCGYYSHKRSQPRKNLPSETGRSNNCNTDNGRLQSTENLRLKPQKGGSRASILSKEEVDIEKQTSRGEAKKKERTCLVEVVDLKCNNPMSSRLKKFGFSKLSESMS